MFLISILFFSFLLATGLLDRGRLVSDGVVFLNEATGFGTSIINFCVFHFVCSFLWLLPRLRSHDLFLESEEQYTTRCCVQSSGQV